MNLDAYLIRIGYAGPRTPTLATLTALAAAQPHAIAFENIAVVNNNVPDVALAAVEAKLVQAGRGGYCYEQNTLLLGALRALGFAVTTQLARVRFQQLQDHVGERGHMLLRVDLPEGRFIVDAGFGGLTLTAPVELVCDREQPTPHEPVRFVAVENEYRLQAYFADAWADVYQFDLTPQFAADILPQNWYTATRPGAMFRHNLIVTRPVAGGRYALFNQTLTWRPRNGAPERSRIVGADALSEVLQKTFALSIPDREIVGAAIVAEKVPPTARTFG